MNLNEICSWSFCAVFLLLSCVNDWTKIVMVSASMAESKQFMNGKVLRVAVANVMISILNYAILFYLNTEINIILS